MVLHNSCSRGLLITALFASCMTLSHTLRYSDGESIREVAEEEYYQNDLEKLYLDNDGFQIFINKYQKFNFQLSHFATFVKKFRPSLKDFLISIKDLNGEEDITLPDRFFVKGWFEYFRKRFKDLHLLYENLRSIMEANSRSMEEIHEVLYSLVTFVSTSSKMLNSVSSSVIKFDEDILNFFYFLIKEKVNQLSKSYPYIVNIKKFLYNGFFLTFHNFAKFSKPFASIYVEEIDNLQDLMYQFGFNINEIKRTFKILHLPQKMTDNEDLDVSNDIYITNNNLGQNYSNLVKDSAFKIDDNEDYYLFENENNHEKKSSLSKRNADPLPQDSYRTNSYIQDPSRTYDLHGSHGSHGGYGYGYNSMVKYVKEDPLKIFAGLAFVAFVAPLVYNVVSSIKTKRSINDFNLGLSDILRPEEYTKNVDSFHEYFNNKYGIEEEDLEKELINPVNDLWKLLNESKKDVSILIKIFFNKYFENNRSTLSSKTISLATILFSILSTLKGQEKIPLELDKEIVTFLERMM